MTDRVDTFESIFKRASKARFRFQRPAMRHLVLVTDRDEAATTALLSRVQRFLAVLEGVEWTCLHGSDFNDVSALVAQLERLAPDGVVTSRNLKQTSRPTPHSLGVYLDTLTQATAMPILVLPDEDTSASLANTDTVMVVTDHLTADERLVNFGIGFTQQGGTVHLCHVEDGVTFQYYLEAIERIPRLDTQTTATALQEELLRRPSEYIASCISELAVQQVAVQAAAHVQMGDRLHDYRQLIRTIGADLVVLNTKDHDQMAMHGVAYMMSVEFRDVAMLML